MKNPNIGEMFFQWAEREWKLEEIVKAGIQKDEQLNLFQYYYLRKQFVDQINDLVQNFIEPIEPREF